MFVDARPAPDVYDDEPWELVAAYRVTLWEQPAMPTNIDQPARGLEPDPPFPGAPMGWEEMTFELAGAHDVREVIQWAETTLASGEGPASGRGVPVPKMAVTVAQGIRETITTAPPPTRARIADSFRFEDSTGGVGARCLGGGGTGNWLMTDRLCAGGLGLSRSGSPARRATRHR